MAREITIHVGEFFGSVEPAIIKTLLGSCVAVCLFDPFRKIRAMNHIFLPGQAYLKHFDAQARFGINAMELLINEMLSLGADRRQFLTKAFGGAHVLPVISDENNPGLKISISVKEYLENEAIRLVELDLGRNQKRHVHFHTDTGDAFIKKIPSAQIREIWSEEQKALKQIRKKLDKPGTITIDQ